MTLAIEGGKPIVTTPIKRRNSVSGVQVAAACEFLHTVAKGDGTLSGYLAGSTRGGGAVQRLEDIFCDIFDVSYAVACNSGTSALLAACVAAGVNRNTVVTIPTMGMSAAAAAPKLLGSRIKFADVDDHFLLDPGSVQGRHGDVVIAVNLFGRPCQLHEMRGQCTVRGITLIEDACQSLWASEKGRHAGTIGHMGCFSFNVHKPLNAGEGGLLVTNDEEFAERARAFINHGECQERSRDIGLNLRMTELTAVVVLSQIEESKRIVERNRQIFQTVYGNDPLDGVVSDHYCLPMLLPTKAARDRFVALLRAEGVPCTSGYVLMHKMPAFDWYSSLPVAEGVNDRLALIETCSLDPTDEQVLEMAAAIDAVKRSIW